MMRPTITDPQAQRRKWFINLVKKRIQSGTGSSITFLKQRRWTFSVSNLREIIKQVPFVIVGGVATRLYMPERMTVDIDILVKAEDARLVYEDLEQAGGKKEGNLSIPGSQWTLNDGTCIDILEVADAWGIEAIEHPNYAPDGLPVIALPYLVLMKLLAGRSQDLADVSRMLGGATEVQLEEVRAVINQYLSNAVEDLESLIMLGRLEHG
nr:nucleotidyl transferase AbiEii/AbiGii toxin family protein [Dactylococcopsis salina]